MPVSRSRSPSRRPRQIQLFYSYLLRLRCLLAKYIPFSDNKRINYRKFQPNTRILLRNRSIKRSVKHSLKRSIKPNINRVTMNKTVELVNAWSAFEEKHPDGNMEDFCRYHLI